MARTFTKNLANHMDLGVNALGPVLAGAGTILVLAQVRPTTYDTSAGDNVILKFFIDGAAPGVQVGINGLAAANVIRYFGRSQPADTNQEANALTAITTANWHTVGHLIDIAGDSVTHYLDGSTDGPADTATFGALTYTNGTPTNGDRVGRTQNAQTNQQFAGDIEFVGVWLDVNATQAGTIASEVHAGTTHPFDTTPGPAFLMVFGYETPDVDLVGGTIQSTITGSLPFVEGLVGLPAQAAVYTLDIFSADIFTLSDGSRIFVD